MSVLKDLTKLVYDYGDANDNYRVILDNVWLYNSVGGVNLFITDGKLRLTTYTNFKYSVATLRGCEQLSLLESMEKYVANID